MVSRVCREVGFRGAGTDTHERGRGGHDIVVVVIVLLGHGEELLRRRIDTFTPKSQFPVSERTVMLIYFSVLYNNTPFADPRFSPRKCQLILKVFE